MKAEKTRVIIECIPDEIKESMGGFEKALEELNELERLAKIGEATEKMFDNCEEVMMVNLESTPTDWDEERVIKQSFVYTEDLVKWSEGVEE